MSLGLGCFGPRGANELRRANEHGDKSPLGKFPVSSCSARGAIGSGDQSWQGITQGGGQWFKEPASGSSASTEDLCPYCLCPGKQFSWTTSRSLPRGIFLALFWITFFSLGTVSICLCVSILISARNQSLSGRRSGLPMLRVMEPRVHRSNIFISLVEQLFQLSHPPELETEGSFQRPSVSPSLCCSHLLGWDSSSLSVAFSTKVELVLSPVRCQDLFPG